MTTDDTPSGDALDRATALISKHGVWTGPKAELIADVARLIERADAATDTKMVAAAQERSIHRRAAQGIIDGCTDSGRGVDGRSYWRLVERVILFLEQMDRIPQLEDRAREANTAGLYATIDDLRSQLAEARGEKRRLFEEMGGLHEEIERLRGELHRTAQQGGSEVDALKQRITAARDVLDMS